MPRVIKNGDSWAQCGGRKKQTQTVTHMLQKVRKFLILFDKALNTLSVGSMGAPPPTQTGTPVVVKCVTSQRMPELFCKYRFNASRPALCYRFLKGTKKETHHSVLCELQCCVQ